VRLGQPCLGRGDSFALELSDELLPLVCQSFQSPKWHFAGYSVEQMTNLFRSCLSSEADLARVMEGAEMEFLLPAFARTHLYTFPEAPAGSAPRQQENLWMALNFFNDHPDDRYLRDGDAQKALRTDYETTAVPPTYGDLIALTSPGGGLLHVSVYVADDVVFTKSGEGPLQPWVLMKIPDMLANFRSLGQVHPVTYHRKQT
jgi:hypothetical protein